MKLRLFSKAASYGILVLIALSARAGLSFEVPESAQAVGALDEGEARAVTRLILDRRSIDPDERFHAGVLFELDAEWHVYGRDPGDAGLPTSIVWSGRGVAPGETQWPPTETFLDPSGRITTTGYSERVVLAAPVVAEDADGEVTVTAEVDYLACRVKCLPGSAVLSRTIPVGESEPATDEVLALFERFGTNRPVAGTEGTADQPERAPPAEPPAPSPSPLPLWQALLFALLGGLLLNLMPCVFPVLALKVFGLVSGGGASRSVALRHSGAYAAGILLSMLALAGAVLAFRWAGSQVGWGFQFQEPGYLVALTLVVTLFALNLFGLFDVPMLPVASRADHEATIGRSFADGVLAVVLATPCSAPFLGVAVGFALAASTATILAIFLAVGLGLAAPYVVVSAVPAVARRLPKPGPWMEKFERVLGFLLLGTAVWLVWVFGRVVGVDAVARLLAALVVAALGAWIWGQLQYGDRKRRAIGGVAIVSGIVVGLVAFTPWRGEQPQATRSLEGDWEPWDPELIEAAQSDGRVVFVDFTADWCITCKVNERTVLASDEVREAFDSEDVVIMKADWTRRDDTIRAELATFGRGGVPLYLVYPAGGGEPEILPEVLTPTLVLDALERARRRH